MDRLIIKFFGVTRLNVIGWCVAGLFLLALGFTSVFIALRSYQGVTIPSHLLVLTAIFLMLSGILGVLLQLYASMLAEKLESQQSQMANDEVK
jgi:uncharacterized protein involved in cysteine biosynthesis